MSLRIILYFIAALGVARISLASAVVVDAGAARQPIDVVELLPNQSGGDNDALARLMSLNGELLPIGKRLGKAYKDVWVRITLLNQGSVDLERVLYIPNNFGIKAVDFYYHTQGAWQHKTYQPDQAGPENLRIGRSSYTTIILPAGSSLPVYVKVQTGYDPLNHNFYLGTRQEFINWEVLSTVFVGLFLGILFITVLATLMQAAAYRELTLLRYSAYCGSLMISALAHYGIWLWLFGDWESQMHLAFIGSFLVLTSGTVFMRPLLDTENLSPVLDKIPRAIPYVAAVSLVLRLFPVTAEMGFTLININSILFVLLICIAGVNAMLHGRELAWLYTGSFLFIALSVIYVRLSQLNVIPMSPNAFYAPAVGHILQIVFISYVVFVKSRNAYTEVLRSQRNHSMNERLNLLLKIISHDIANPLQAISPYCNMAQSKVKAQQLPQHELEKVQEAIHAQMRIIKHAKEAVRQMQLGQKVQIQPVHVSQVLNEVLQIFQPLCHDRGIRLEVQNELREDLLFHTDPTILVHNIFGNVLSNSIKFTPQNGLIRIRVRCQNRRLIFDLIDTGPGMSKEKRMEIFTLNLGKGFNEQLTGAGSFGLSILQMCSEILHGDLDIGPSAVTEDGQELGLRITVSLPLHHAL